MLTAALSACRPHPPDALTTAAANGDVSEVRRLVAGGTPVEGVGGAALTPLAVAAREGRPLTIRTLVRLGADPNALDEAGWPPLLHAVGQKKLAAVQALLESGADPNQRPTDGPPPLFAAATNGETAIVRALLDAGADPRAESPGGNALSAAVGGPIGPGHFVRGTCQPDTVRVVLAAAPDLKLPTRFPGSSAVWAARRANCAEVLKMVEGR